VLFAAGWFFGGQARSKRLRNRFGPEYDRHLEEAGDRRTAERELAEREKRHAQLELRALSPEDAKRGDVVWVALRPEKVRIAPERPGSAEENCVAGEVTDIGYLGDLSIYKVRLDNGFVMKAAVANVTRLVERSIGWDDRVWLSWAPEAATVLTR